MTPDSIERETTIEAPVERVWELLTQADHVGRWFGDAGAEIDLRPGGEMVMHWRDHGSTRARIETVEPHTRFAYRWAPYKDPGGDAPVDGNSTRVEFTLTPDGGGTRLRVVETGFASLATSDEQREKNHADNTEGWAQELGELADYAAKVAV
jgi:uncharacterized protein YndB with AHSA1/START domain